MAATILHLTDLHLGGGNPRAEAGDYGKSDLVPPRERATRERLLRATLREMTRELQRRDAGLDAVVVGGDITFGGDEDGYKALDGVLAELGTLLPPPERVVVVP